MGHRDPITSAAFFDEGRRAITASWDPSLKVWDLENGRLLKTLVGHASRINAVAAFPDGDRAVSGGSDKLVWIWDLETGRDIHVLRGHGKAVSAVAVCGGGNRVISGSDDGTLKLWNADSGRELLTLTGHTGEIHAVAVSPDGQRALSGSGDNTLRLWDLSTGRGLRTLSGHEGGGVMAVEMFAGGRLAISAGADSNLKIWDLEQGVELRTLTAHADIVLGVTVLGDERRAVSSSTDGTIHVWGLDTVDALAATKAHAGGVETVVVPADGRRAISLASYPTELRAWDLATGAQVAPPVVEIGPLDQLKALPPAEWVQVVGTQGYATRKIWHLASGSRLGADGRVPEQASTMTLLWVGRMRALFAGERGLLVWDLPPANRVRWLAAEAPHGRAEIHAIAVYPNERRALSAGDDGVVRAWDLEAGRDLGGVRAHNNGVKVIALSADGRRAVSRSQDGAVCLWNLEAPIIRVLATFSGQRRDVLRPTLAVAARHGFWGDDRGTITVCDLETGLDRYELAGHTGGVLALAACKDGLLAVSGSQDRTVRVWDLQRREEIAAFSADGSVDACALTEDGSTVIAGDRVGQVHVLRLRKPDATEEGTRA